MRADSLAIAAYACPAAESSDQETCWLDPMAWTSPQYPKERVNKCAKTAVALLNKYYALGPPAWDNWAGDDGAEYDICADVVNNWRASHGYPLNILQINLRRSARKIDPNVVI